MANSQSKHPRVPNPLAKRYVDPVIEYYKAGIDRSLIRRNLQLSIDERFEQLMRLQQFAEETESAGKQVRPND